MIIYDKEGKLSICAKDRFRPCTTVRSKHRITFDAEEFAKLSSTIESIHEGYVEDGTLPQPTPVKEYDPQDPLEISLFKTPSTPRTWSRTPRQTPGLTLTPRSSRRLTAARLKKKSVPPRKRLIPKKNPKLDIRSLSCQKMTMEMMMKTMIKMMMTIYHLLPRGRFLFQSMGESFIQKVHSRNLQLRRSRHQPRDAGDDRIQESKPFLPNRGRFWLKKSS